MYSTSSSRAAVHTVLSCADHDDASVLAQTLAPATYCSTRAWSPIGCRLSAVGCRLSAGSVSHDQYRTYLHSILSTQSEKPRKTQRGKKKQVSRCRWRYVLCCVCVRGFGRSPRGEPLAEAERQRGRSMCMRIGQIGEQSRCRMATLWVLRLRLRLRLLLLLRTGMCRV